MGKIWTNEQIEDLKRMLSERVGEKPTFQEIGYILGVSKGAIAGKVRRLRALNQVAQLSTVEVVEENNTRPKGFKLAPANRVNPGAVTPPKRTIMRGEDLEPLGLPGMPLDSSKRCAYIYGDPKQSGWRYCGRDTCEEHASYCEAHFYLCHNPAHPKIKAPRE